MKLVTEFLLLFLYLINNTAYDKNECFKDWSPDLNVLKTTKKCSKNNQKCSKKIIQHFCFIIKKSIWYTFDLN